MDGKGKLPYGSVQGEAHVHKLSSTALIAALTFPRLAGGAAESSQHSLDWTSQSEKPWTPLRTDPTPCGTYVPIHQRIDTQTARYRAISSIGVVFAPLPPVEGWYLPGCNEGEKEREPEDSVSQSVTALLCQTPQSPPSFVKRRSRLLLFSSSPQTRRRWRCCRGSILN
ncbi:hypothetical protein BHE74_00046221 [Ensete ventricosum]|nr:hypothetical protein GW17_00015181 [Ensete ventricosum]RWW47771.1 hypothetical protein BHE74_00046221 [Ensete ventricosum]